MLPIAAFLTPTRLALIGLAAVALAGLTWGSVEHQRAKRYQAEAEQAITTAKGLTTAVVSKDEVIAKQLAQARAMMETISEQNLRIKAAGHRIEEMTEDMRARSRRLRELEETDRANPDCRALLDTELDRVCPAIASGVRERANRSLQRPNR